MDKKIEKVYLSYIDISYLNNFIEHSEPNKALRLIRERLPIDRRQEREIC